MRILITGGAGFIGSNLANYLIKQGYAVVILDNLLSQIHGNNPQKNSPLYLSLNKKIEFIKGDVCVKDDWLRALKDIEVVVHLAAETGTGQSMYKIQHYNHVNVLGTAILMDILTNHSHTVKKVVVASSRAIYGEGKYITADGQYVYPKQRQNTDLSKGEFRVSYNNDYSIQPVATDENSIIHPTSVYGITKQVQEQLVLTVAEALGIKGVALRYQNVYGPGQSLTNPYTGILSIFSSRILQNQSINIFEDGLESRDFVFIDDVVKATALAIEHNTTNTLVCNVGTGTPITVKQVVQNLLSGFNKEVLVQVTGNYRIGDIRHNFADITKMKQELGVVELTSFEEGITAFIEWVKKQNIGSNNYELSLEEMKNKGLFK